MRRENDSEKRRQAAALSYNPDGSGAPKLVAKGRGKIADNIIAKAEEYQIPIQQDSSLVEILGQLEINEAIPEELYQAVAEIFAFIYRLDQKADRR
ncbi:flagellar biosynthesis protein [Bacillus ectoiniformans]|uniref:EscU/YscU/HrcU family type III secretion system export apparatus switch protein n=1 Tax=Bacillus ectoiniformans TaxID=1494429 RepID=UPI0019590C27|nr:EscU/YscU/HrcU family type III secretion system export apparatus switch protein [Bacillus ectoiniformans]MBM7647147.1 flagellar biosynthesis protein [Bacillus ectoiniformans]